MIYQPSDAPLRPTRFGSREGVAERRPDGSVLLRRKEALQPHPVKLTERLEYWAGAVPDRPLFSEMDSTGRWNGIRWGETLSKTRALAQAFIERDLSAERPVAVLSENSIEHALISLACMTAGIPCVAVSPSYSLLAKDFMKLRQVLALANPGLVFAQDGERYARAIEAVVPAECEVAVADKPYPRTGRLTLFSRLLATHATSDVDAARARVGPDTVAKLLFTSGSTGTPKAVPVTQRMVCANQQGITQVMPFLTDRPPVLVDWLPWHHTFGGNNNVGMVITHGGSFYIDQGRPMPGLIEKTVRALSTVSPTMYLSVPKGIEMLIPYLQKDKALASSLFDALQATMFGGAPMPRHLLDAMIAVEVQTTGERIPNINGVGSTDAGPTALSANWDVGNQPIVGLPVPGLEAKILPAGNKLELRLRGPSILTHYWKDPERTKAAFDEEGFFKIGDAVTWLEPDRPERGLVFNGRVVEDFKLATGTWVSVGGLRDRLIEGAAPLVRDAVITGHGGDWVGAMVFLNVDACQSRCDLPAGAPFDQVASHPAVRTALQAVLDRQDPNAGSSVRIERLVIEAEQPSLDNGELTDKNTVSQRSVLDRRATVVAELHAARPSPRSIQRKH